MDPNDLYGLPLERFTGERNALAKQLRQEGRREEASDVAKLRKPSVAAWAVNQLVRTRGREVKQLFAAGNELQKVQEALLAGRAEGGALRSAVEAERAAVDRLTDSARGLLSSEGQELTAAKLEQVSETLHAAALDADAREQVLDGCLHRELRHIGLGALPAGPARAKASPAKLAADKRRPNKQRPPKARGTSGPGATTKRAAEQRAARAADVRASRERASRLKNARKLEADARRRMERAASDLKAAQQARDRAAAALRDADGALAKARQSAQERLEEHRRTREALDAEDTP